MTMKYFRKIERNGHTFYQIRKHYNGKEYQILHTPDKETALRVYKECQDKKWEKEEILQIRQHYREHPPLKHKHQYITRDTHGGYRVSKWKQGRLKYYGKARTLEDAIKIRDHLIQTNWRKPVFQKNTYHHNKYLLRRDNGQYELRKRVNGGLVYFGIYKSVKDAREDRDFWENINWDFDLLDLH